MIDEKDWNFSDKIAMRDLTPFVYVRDIKEFIKRLKEKYGSGNEECDIITLTNYELDTLAGEELTRGGEDETK